MQTRRPNTGPYIVTYEHPFNGLKSEVECNTWSQTCEFMRSMLIKDYKVSVRFA